MKPEESLHRSCVRLLQVHENMGHLSYCHVPNGGYRHKAEAGVLQALGVRAGVPDLLVWLPGGHTVQVELKAKGGKLSPGQINWSAQMAALGHRVSVARSLDDLGRILGAAGVPSLGKGPL